MDGGLGRDEGGPSARLDSEAPDEVPEHVAAALTQFDESLAVLLEVRYAALTAGELRALTRALTSRHEVLSAAGLRVLAAMDRRDDVVPKGPPGKASITFQRHALGLSPFVAQRESTAAHLLDADTGDLTSVGAAYAAGRIRRGHVDVAVRTHRELGADLRAEVIPFQGCGGDGGQVEGVGEPQWVRRIVAVDALITQWSLHLTVPEVDALARALVRELNPKQPNGAHEQRFCHMSQDLNGNWAGRFACGQTQGALIKAAIAAGARPRPGLAVDEHGVQRELPDRRDLGQRQMDALADLVAIAAARAGVNLPGAARPRPDSEPWPDHFGQPQPTDPAGTDVAAEDPDIDAAVEDPDTEDPDTEDADSDADPDAGLHADLEGDLDAGLHADLDAGFHADLDAGFHADPDADLAGLGADLGADLGAGGDERPGADVDRGTQGCLDPKGIGEPPPAEGEYVVLREPGVLSGPYPPVKILVTVDIAHLAAALAQACPPQPPPLGHPPPHGSAPPTSAPTPRDEGQDAHDGDGMLDVVARLRGQPWIQHAGHPGDATLAELATRARLQRVLHTSDGAVLALGRTVRLATSTQKHALIARDVGCAIPGCGVPGEHCEVHHVIPWAAGGPTDLENMILLCSRHHTETGQGTWEIVMKGGVPWVRLPSWVDRTRPVLRNHTHRRPPDPRSESRP
jgi:hypothetical protein